MVFLNPDYVARLFKKSTGQSISEYVTMRRMERPKTILASQDVLISEVASMVGYDNFAYFSKLFKRDTGCSPSEYRQRMKNNQ